jgi:hypothetical protein
MVMVLGVRWAARARGPRDFAEVPQENNGVIIIMCFAYIILLAPEA